MLHPEMEKEWLDAIRTYGMAERMFGRATVKIDNLKERTERDRGRVKTLARLLRLLDIGEGK